MSSAQERRFKLDIALTLNGAYLGDIPVETTVDGKAVVNAVKLLTVIRSVASRAVVADLERRAGGRAEVPLEELNSDQIQFAFDLASLRLTAVLGVNGTLVSTLSLSGVDPGNPALLTQPSNFAFGVTASIFDRFVHSAVFEPVGERGIQGSLRGFANVGGTDGVYLTFDSGLRDSRNAFGRVEFEEGPRATLFYDDTRRAIRYSVGTIEPYVRDTFQTPLRIVGIGVERLYETIQPYRNLRPSGRGGLILERPSRVDILVNGQVQRTLQLAAGRYDLRDFPFLSGTNDVSVVVEDATGRREATALSFFSDTLLLNPGITNFSLVLGETVDRFNTFLINTRRDGKIVTGYVQRGITDRLTLGTSIQAERDNAVVGGQLVFAAPIGLVGVQAAVDRSRGEPLEYAAVLSWRQQSYRGSGVASGLLVDATYQSARFSPLEPSVGLLNSRALDIDARYQTPLGARTFVSAGGGYGIGRGLQPDEYRLSATATRSFATWSLNLAVDQRFGGFGNQTNIGLSVSVPLTRRLTARARYQSSRNETAVEIDRIAYPGLDELGYRLSAVRSDDGEGLDGDVRYYGNRFQGSVRHSFSDSRFGRSQVTDVAVTTGVGYAGGKFAWGREADRGFVIVDRHRSLADAQITARSTTSLGPSARVGGFGPGLVPLLRSYVNDSISIDVQNLPSGYDIGAGRFDIRPGAASGYRIQVGSDASNTIVGNLAFADGSPASLVTGELRRLDGRAGDPVNFFTNRTGRMVAQRVAPGRYGLVLAGDDTASSEVAVSEGANGLVDVGRIVIGRQKR